MPKRSAMSGADLECAVAAAAAAACMGREVNVVSFAGATTIGVDGEAAKGPVAAQS